MFGLGLKAKLIAAAVIVTLFGIVIGLYGNARFNAGVTETINGFTEADQKGANDVRSKADKLLKGTVGMSHGDVLDVLRSNGGLRANPQ